jgi:hypothetical protein
MRMPELSRSDISVCWKELQKICIVCINGISISMMANHAPHEHTAPEEIKNRIEETNPKLITKEREQNTDESDMNTVNRTHTITAA